MTTLVTTLLQIAVLIPATYIGVLYLLEEDGPWSIFHHIRIKAGFKEVSMTVLSPDGKQETSVEYHAGDNFWSRVLDCPRCLSPYVAFLVVLFGLTVGILRPNALLLVVWLGLAGSTVYFFEKGA
jgi:hypothetical protein